MDRVSGSVGLQPSCAGGTGPRRSGTLLAQEPEQGGGAAGGPLLSCCGLPGDLGWRRGPDSAGQQDCGAFPDGVGTQGHPEPGPAARAQLPQLLGLPDLCLGLEMAEGSSGDSPGVRAQKSLVPLFAALRLHPHGRSPNTIGQRLRGRKWGHSGAGAGSPGKSSIPLLPRVMSRRVSL